MARDMNALTSPSYLPSEILAEIFAQCDPWKYPANFSPDCDDYSNNKKIFPLAQVSHHWRQVALDHPRLWCHIRLHMKPEYNQMLLERSKDAALYVEASLSGARLQNSGVFLLNIPAIFREISRIRFLCGSLASKSLLALLRSAHPNGGPLVAPRLTTYVEGLGFEPDESLSMLSVLTTPNLRSATVMPTHSTLRYLQSHPLVHLTIMSFLSNYYEEPVTARSLQDVVDLLRATPSLEILHLNLRQDFTPFPASTSIASIPLPKLNKLRIEGDLLVLESLVRRFELPSSASISGHLSVDCTEGVSDEDADAPRLANAIQYMLQRFCGSSDESMCAAGVVIGLELHVSTALRCWFAGRPANFSSRHGDSYDRGTDREHYLDFDLGYDSGLASSILHHSSTMSAIRYLISTSCHAIREGHQVLQELSGIEEVTFFGLSLLRINHLLDVRDGTDVPMPNLRTMRLISCAHGVGSVPHVAGHGEGDKDDIPRGYDGCEVCQGPAEFLRVLRQRRDAGSPIHRLFLTEREHRWWLTGLDMQRDMLAVVLDRVAVNISSRREDLGY